MSALSLCLIFLAQIGLVAGQIFLKRGVNATHRPDKPLTKIAGNIAAGVAMLTVWFLLWMGLLQKFDLSYIYPFEGISPVLLVLAAFIFLKETLSARAWAGVLLIALGTALVGMS